MQEKRVGSISYWIDNPTADKTLVFLHPAFVDHRCFDNQLAYFAKTHCVIALDLIGHGKSLGKGDITETADVIAQIMAAESIEKIHLVGVSIGAVLASSFANQYPDKLLSLTCIGGYDINNFDVALMKANSNQQTRMIMRGLFSIKSFAEKNKQIACHTPEGQEAFYQMCLGFKKSSFRYLAKLGQLINQAPTPERDYPLLIGIGVFDNSDAVRAAKDWATHEPGALFIEFGNAGHVVNLDQPEEFNRHIANFIQ